MTKDRPLEGKVAIVTGGAKGIGAVICEYLAEDGAHVALAGRNEEALRARAAALDERFPGLPSLPVRCDVTDERQVQDMVAAVAWPVHGHRHPREHGGRDRAHRNARA